VSGTVLVGHALDVLRSMPSESVDCCVTSPPYWGLRDYKTKPIIWDAVEGCEHEWGEYERPGQSGGTVSEKVHTHGTDNFQAFGPSSQAFCFKCGAWRGQLGLEPTPQLYIQHLVSIFDEVKRVLKKTGTCWVNIGDTYGGTTQFAKSLVQIPSRFAIAMTDAGWILRNEIVWHKPNCMPSSVKDRFTVDFEKLFFFVKSKRYYFEQQFEPMSEASVSRYKYKFGGTKNEAIKETDNPTYVVGMRSPTDGRNKRTVWTITTKAYKGAHFAVFPPELVETPIKAGCPPGGVVLDPFGGSGTTAAVAKQLGRNSIMIELNPNYIPLMEERVGDSNVKIVDMLGGAEE
jgi:site-specific DNA-methyltransferase (cytosine-N4-specific)